MDLFFYFCVCFQEVRLSGGESQAQGGAGRAQVAGGVHGVAVEQGQSGQQCVHGGVVSRPQADWIAQKT